jgi:16S rRNA (guanine527-N7)-methyltransferase
MKKSMLFRGKTLKTCMNIIFCIHWPLLRLYVSSREQRVLDVGTGGGFPGIPLAIIFPESTFVLIDSIGKKIKVATEVSTAIGLKNITLKHLRLQEEKGKFDFVVSRAVMPLGELVKLVKKNISKISQNATP